MIATQIKKVGTIDDKVKILTQSVNKHTKKTHKIKKLHILSKKKKQKKPKTKGIKFCKSTGYSSLGPHMACGPLSLQSKPQW